MNGVSIKVTWEGGGDPARIRRGLELLARAGRDLGPMMAEIGQVVVENTDERWREEVDPDGKPWAPNSASTKAQKAAQGRIQKVLQSTGRLRGSIVHQLVGRDAVAVGTNVEYAATHQLGVPGPWIIRPKKKKALWWPGLAHPVGKVTHPGIKPRPFLGISREDTAAIGRILKLRVAEVLRDAR